MSRIPPLPLLPPLPPGPPSAPVGGAEADGVAFTVCIPAARSRLCIGSAEWPLGPLGRIRPPMPCESSEV